jgi:hypothetical protein
MRTCKKCGVSKPLEAFQIYDAEKGLRRHECRECLAGRLRRYAKESVDRIRAYKRKYHEANRDKIIDRVNEWVQANPDKRRKNALSHYYRLQDEAIRAYGGYTCNWCGIDEPLVLCIDHVENDGAKHRRELGFLGGARFYKWLRDRGYPQGFQVLCMNCNHAKHRNKGVLPESLRGRCNDYPERE